VRQRVSDCFAYSVGNTPLLISIPHDGRSIPPDIAKRMSKQALELPDTDWHVSRLYDFAGDLDASVVAARYSRYVVDLNRASNDEALYDVEFVTGLCPEKTFEGRDIYLPGLTVTEDEKRQRVESYWQPYHDRIASSLSEIKERFGYALLWDAHSIPSRVPLLFDDELPELNYGTNDGRSCANELIEAVIAQSGAAGKYSMVLNGRFKGGYITRHYGEPGTDIHAIQLELAQRSYMDEKTQNYDVERASQLQSILSKVLQAYLSSAASFYEGCNEKSD
jgi:N-formylglutamate amidohydrolase